MAHGQRQACLRLHSTSEIIEDIHELFRSQTLTVTFNTDGELTVCITVVGAHTPFGGEASTIATELCDDDAEIDGINVGNKVLVGFLDNVLDTLLVVFV